jgi:Holliday junction resolvase RusA-like endonuclease
MIAFTIRGKAHPHARPRFARGRTYEPRANTEWRQEVIDAWRSGSGRRILDGPWVARIEVYEERPKSHKTTKGELNHQGRKSAVPTRGDLDNYAKGVLDALCSQDVVPDDRYMVELHVKKAWAETSRTYVEIRKENV